MTYTEESTSQFTTIKAQDEDLRVHYNDIGSGDTFGRPEPEVVGVEYNVCIPGFSAAAGAPEANGSDANSAIVATTPEVRTIVCHP